eukprot:CAMPEP_0194386654 /NCGR_PEP_ID=MMETSP0174-20130528/87748_1 /TAXON_ID=216777 /ORGANISM="Proboscia alata, Strain PI-D3" /LENGTH=32 /DNA_ID= /DNA_START= /DNA_END= /DNA_ORIENTATION=
MALDAAVVHAGGGTVVPHLVQSAAGEVDDLHG